MLRMHEAPASLVNLIRYGTVQSVDIDRARVTVAVGGLTTKPIPWIAARAGAVRTWSPPSRGEQVLVLSPGGNLGAGVALTGIFYDQCAKPADGTADNVLLAFGDGAVLLYDHVAHLLKGTLPAGGHVELTAPGGFRLVGDIDIDGKLHVTQAVTCDATVRAAQDITSDADVKAGDISLRNHPHDKVQPGSGVSGKPQP
jgi:phage baseplate assembly protein V